MSTDQNTGRVAVITGASSDIGEVTARTVAADGHRVALLARRPTASRRRRDELGNGAIGGRSWAAMPPHAPPRALGHRSEAAGSTEAEVRPGTRERFHIEEHFRPHGAGARVARVAARRGV